MIVSRYKCRNVHLILILHFWWLGRISQRTIFSVFPRDPKITHYYEESLNDLKKSRQLTKNNLLYACNRIQLRREGW